MIDASLAVQKAVKALLSAQSAVTALVGGRIFDDVPTKAAFPYVTVGDVQAIEDGADCIDGAEVNVDIHVWSVKPGSVEAKQIGSAVVDALQNADLDLGIGTALISCLWTGSRFFRDADGITTHGVVSFRALTEAV